MPIHETGFSGITDGFRTVLGDRFRAEGQDLGKRGLSPDLGIVGESFEEAVALGGRGRLAREWNEAN